VIAPSHSFGEVKFPEKPKVHKHFELLDALIIHGNDELVMDDELRPKPPKPLHTFLCDIFDDFKTAYETCGYSYKDAKYRKCWTDRVNKLFEFAKARSRKAQACGGKSGISSLGPAHPPPRMPLLPPSSGAPSSLPSYGYPPFTGTQYPSAGGQSQQNFPQNGSASFGPAPHPQQPYPERLIGYGSESGSTSTAQDGGGRGVNNKGTSAGGHQANDGDLIGSPNPDLSNTFDTSIHNSEELDRAIAKLNSLNPGLQGTVNLTLNYSPHVHNSTTNNIHNDHSTTTTNNNHNNHSTYDNSNNNNDNSTNNNDGNSFSLEDMDDRIGRRLDDLKADVNNQLDALKADVNQHTTTEIKDHQEALTGVITRESKKEQQETAQQQREQYEERMQGDAFATPHRSRTAAAARDLFSNDSPPPTRSRRSEIEVETVHTPQPSPRETVKAASPKETAKSVSFKETMESASPKEPVTPAKTKDTAKTADDHSQTMPVSNERNKVETDALFDDLKSELEDEHVIIIAASVASLSDTMEATFGLKSSGNPMSCNILYFSRQNEYTGEEMQVAVFASENKFDNTFRPPLTLDDELEETDFWAEREYTISETLTNHHLTEGIDMTFGAKGDQISSKEEWGAILHIRGNSTMSVAWIIAQMSQTIPCLVKKGLIDCCKVASINVETPASIGLPALYYTNAILNKLPVELEKIVLNDGVYLFVAPV
jgi:hypothetical protein